MVLKGEIDFDEEPPEDFDPEHPYANPVAMIEMREWIMREKWIGVERAKIIREKVRECYRREGVNHFKNCRKWVDAYMSSIKDVGWGCNFKSIKGPTLPKGWPKKEEEKPVEFA